MPQRITWERLSFPYLREILIRIPLIIGYLSVERCLENIRKFLVVMVKKNFDLTDGIEP